MHGASTPGFTAESSLSSGATEHYRLVYSRASVTDGGMVVPQQLCYPIGRGMYMCCSCDISGCRCESAGPGHILN
jgi:hypothetical protein